MEKQTKLAQALVAFQAQCPAVGFDKKNKHFDNKYATLPAILDAIRPTLTECGLAVVQFPIFEDGRSGCETHLIHESGESLTQRFTVPLAKNDPQGACAAVTYARRYGLSGALGLVIDDDDDGNMASNKPPKPDPAVQRPNRQPEPRTSRPAGMSGATKKKLAFAARERMKELSGDSGTDDDVRAIMTDVARALGYASTVEMLDSDFGRALELVQKWEPAA